MPARPISSQRCLAPVCISRSFFSIHPSPLSFSPCHQPLRLLQGFANGHAPFDVVGCGCGYAPFDVAAATFADRRSCPVGRVQTLAVVIFGCRNRYPYHTLQTHQLLNTTVVPPPCAARNASRPRILPCPHVTLMLVADGVALALEHGVSVCFPIPYQ